VGCKNSHFILDSYNVLLWNEKEISLQLEHRNGIHTDNRLENLELLCCNCHSQTSTYAGKNMKKNMDKRKWLSDEAAASTIDNASGARCVRANTTDV
jgi:5-methylcytosine-specific restriction endonuclease McrA